MDTTNIDILELVTENGAKYLQKLKEENPEKLREYRRRAQEKWRIKQKATIQ